MSGGNSGNLDPRAWIVWAFAASLPAMLGRNPWPLLIALAAVATVRVAWSHRISGHGHWAFVMRLAVLFAGASILFNGLTVRSGDRPIARLPDWLPLLGGEITLNAVVYGLLSAIALVLLVLVGTTVAALLDWPAIIRLLPDGLTTMAVAGSIAFTLLPQTAIAFREIREAQMARGHRIRGARDFLPIIVPMLGGGLERAITLAEALESRGFGGTIGNARRPAWVRYGAATALGLGALAAYAFAVGRAGLAGLAAGAAVGLLVPAVVKGRRSEFARTRYRIPEWSLNDTVVVVAAVAAIGGCLVSLNVAPETLRYEPYPRIALPQVGIPLLATILGLLAPAVLAPPIAHAGGEQP